MTDLRLHTLPGIKRPPPYHLGLGGEDCFTIPRQAVERMHAAAAIDPVRKQQERLIAERNAAIAAFEGLTHQLDAMLREGIETGSGDAWHAFWEAEGRVDAFRDLFDGLRVTERRIVEIGAGTFPSVEETSHHCHDLIEAIAPSVRPVVEYAEHVLSRSFRIACDLVRTPVPDDRRQQDSDYAARFNWASSWALVALNTLLFTAEHANDDLGAADAAENILGMAIAAARAYSLEAHHAVREGKRLREAAQQQAVEAPGESREHDDMVEDDDLADVEAAIEAEEVGRGGSSE